MNDVLTKNISRPISPPAGPQAGAPRPGSAPPSALVRPPGLQWDAGARRRGSWSRYDPTAVHVLERMLPSGWFPLPGDRDIKDYDLPLLVFVGYGGAGGTRAVEHLRLVMGGLMVADVRAQVALSRYTDFENCSACNAACKETDDEAQRLFQPLISACHQRLVSRQPIQQREHTAGHVSGHHGCRRRARHGEAQKSELARHRGYSDHSGDAGHESLRVGGRIIDDAEHQDTREQQKLNQQKRPDQGWTPSVGRFGD